MAASLRQFLLAVDPSPLPDIWGQEGGEPEAGSEVGRAAQEQDVAAPAPTAAAPPAASSGVAAAPNTVGDVLRLHPALLQEDGPVRLLLFTLLQQLVGGQRGGSCEPDSVAVTPQLWPLPGPHRPAQPPSPPGACPSDLPTLTSRWVSGQVSNLEYLLCLNRLAGRRPGDPARSPILPWVLDMTADPAEAPLSYHKGAEARAGAEAGAMSESGDSAQLPPPPGWRDLTRSKWRLAKGDEQLDWTFATAPVPHHLPGDVLSDLTYCLYKARQLPEALLTRLVRGRFVAQEYPASLERLYRLTPEECIPEFYTDPSVFTSTHQGMSDLGLPTWASSAEEFVEKHRAALESDYVSARMHHWIDLTFGYKLSGEAAMAAKNVQLGSLPPAAGDGHLSASGYVQLFSTPHPRRRPASHADSTACREGVNMGILAACLQQLEELESSFGSSNPGEGRPCTGEHGLPPLPAQFGQLVIQLYLQRTVHVCPLNLSAWRALLPQLPPAARRLSATCLAGRLSLADISTLDFFTPAVRAAHAFLAPLLSQQPGNRSGEGSLGEDAAAATAAAQEPGSSSSTDSKGYSSSSSSSYLERSGQQERARVHAQAQQLAQVVAEGKLLELLLTPGALGLCTPLLLAMLRAALQLESDQQGQMQALPGNGPGAGAEVAASAPAAAQHAAYVLLTLLGTASRTLCRQHLLPAVASWLGGAGGLPPSSRQLLLSPQLVAATLAGGGMAAYMDIVQPVLLRQLLATGGDRAAVLEGAIVAALGVVARQVAPPITFETTVRPLLKALLACPVAALALVEVAAAMPPHLAASYVLVQLLQAFDPGRKWEQVCPGPLVPAALNNTLAALEGLVPLLPAQLCLRHLIMPPQHTPASAGMPEDLVPSPLLAALLRPDQQPLLALHPAAAHGVLTRLAALVVQVASRSGQEALAQQLLPQLVPLFACPESHRLNYGMDMPSPSPPPKCPQPPPDSSAAAQPGQAAPPASGPGSTHQAAGAAEGQQHHSPGGSNGLADSWAGGASGSDSGYWDLVSTLYPPCLGAVGAEAMHSLVPTWAEIELNLEVRYEWRSDKRRGLSSASLHSLLPAVRELSLRYCSSPQYNSGGTSQAVQEAVRRSEATSRLIDGVAWSSPSLSAFEDSSRGQQGPAGGGGPRHPMAAASTASAAAGGRPLPWSWQGPLDADWLAGLAGGGGPAGQDYFALSNWRLQAAALHELRAHKERLRLCLADEDRQVIITAGKGHMGSRECEAIRTWALGDGEPGAQYVQHDSSPITSMCLVGAGAAGSLPQVVSCDASGALHVWALTSGEQSYCFREAPGGRAPSQLRCRGWLQAYPTIGAAMPPQSPAHALASPHHPESSYEPGREFHHPISTDGSSHGGPGGFLGGGAFTCVANLAQGEAMGSAAGFGSDAVAAGTSGGCLCLVDVERAELGSHFDCAPISHQGPGSVAVSSLCCTGSWLAAGTRGGWVSVLDARSGEVVWWFRRHEAAVTALGDYRGHYLVSAAKEGWVKLWDLRMGAAPRGAGWPPGSHPQPQTFKDGSSGLQPSLVTGASIPLCLGTFRLGVDGSPGGVGGLAMYGDQGCICFAGSSLGVVSLTPGGGTRSRMAVTRLQGLGGAQLSAPIQGLSLLPLSRLFVVGTEDGWVRVCR